MAEFRTEILLGCPPEEVFAFHARPANLLRVSPPAWHLKLLRAPEELRLGSELELQMHRFGVSQRAVARVTEYDPPYRFVDEQVSGPFARWRHAHVCEPSEGGGTRLLDIIEFDPPRGLLRFVLTRRLILHELHEAFRYRHARTKELLEAEQRQLVRSSAGA